MAAILYERQIELAFEGKRFDDMRRWLLFDGGAYFSTIPGAPSTWTLTGWGGNTCTWLGVKPMNGQRRDNMRFRVADDFPINSDSNVDPLEAAGVQRCAALDYRNSNIDAQIAVLRDWYSNNLTRKRTLGDGRDANKVELTIRFQPQYYIIGLCNRAQTENPGLEQIIGWEDYNHRPNMGTFDPLAE